MARRDADTERGSGPWWRSGAWVNAGIRVVLLATAWWALCDADPSSVTFGVFVVTAVAWVSFRLSPPRPGGWSPLEVLRFALFFFSGSVRGGADVAYRALAPSLPISPVLIRYRMRLPSGAPQTLFRITLSLMPGTLNADVLGDEVVVHALVDRGEGLHHELDDLEWRVSRLFGLRLPPREAAHG